ncbi:Zinc-finger domain of monoamine-oxidase A repressor R1 [Macleaya cordata]|uniref:Zinc-finger domain of monoamine-oxidase A repressor R1 n=1 Tax=Macleaya cordata TaxID=56857 RepID=A0A200QPZ4_MACCD|nr:Zinc-finger domain of monoamine-oxidase A repressor R1 [Macleaya cordata]
MVKLKNRVLQTPETPASNEQTENNVEKAQMIIKTDVEVSGYEQSREKRIKENIEKLQELGIVNLSLKLKSDLLLPSKSTPTKKPSQIIVTPQPSRRSSRSQSSTPVSKSKVGRKKKKKKEKLVVENVEEALVGQDSKLEIYTEEHEKLLGKCERSWKPFVDGYGKDGKRLFDPVKGKLCHQCGQKTVGYHTQCSKCNLDQGQLCGDCLYMRYGENVLETNKNPNWICPVCRGICNCSQCREAKGWLPIGNVYWRVSSLGFKSVAHYLIQTQR